MTVLDEALAWVQNTRDAEAMSSRIGFLIARMYPKVIDAWNGLVWRAPKSCALIMRRLHEAKMRGGDEWTDDDSRGFLQAHLESMIAVLVETKPAKRLKRQLQKAN